MFYWASRIFGTEFNTMELPYLGASIFGSFHINAPLLWKSMQTNRARFHRTLDFIGFFAFHTATNIGGGCIFGSRQPSLRKDRACPRYRVAPLARQSLTRFENIKSLSSCFKRGRRIARIGTQREANALCVSSAKCRLFEISYVSLDDCFAALQIVYPPCGGRRISPRLIDLTVYGIVPFFPVSTI